MIVSELWFQVQDTETGEARGPARELLKDAVADKRGLPEGIRPDVKIGRVAAKATHGNRTTPGVKGLQHRNGATGGRW